VNIIDFVENITGAIQAEMKQGDTLREEWKVKLARLRSCVDTFESSAKAAAEVLRLELNNAEIGIDKELDERSAALSAMIGNGPANATD